MGSGAHVVAVAAGTRAAKADRLSVRTKDDPFAVHGAEPPTMAVYVLRLQGMADGFRTAMSLERGADLLVDGMRSGGV